MQSSKFRMLELPRRVRHHANGSLGWKAAIAKASRIRELKLRNDADRVDWARTGLHKLPCFVDERI
jgi:hypothetical protein